MSDLVPVEKVADQLSCCQETVRRMLRRGELPGVKVGRDWRVDPGQVAIALSQGGVDGGDGEG